MKSLEGAANDELSHYYERSWEAIFYPINNTYFINYTSIFSSIYFKICSLYLEYHKQQTVSKNNNHIITELSLIVKPMIWNFVYFINTYTYYGYDL
jgi:hypothetical protein